MTPDRWISVVSICLTFCLAFLTLVLIVLTLKEMKKQRKTMYIPIWYLVKTIFIFIGISLPTLLIFGHLLSLKNPT